MADIWFGCPGGGKASDINGEGVALGGVKEGVWVQKCDKEDKMFGGTRCSQVCLLTSGSSRKDRTDRRLRAPGEAGKTGRGAGGLVDACWKHVSEWELNWEMKQSPVFIAAGSFVA